MRHLVYGIQFQGSRIDTVPQAGGRRAIGKHMAQVGVTLATKDLGASCEQRVIILFGDIFCLCWLKKAGPAGPRVKLCLRRKQFGFTASATVDARSFAVPVFACEGSFGPFLARDTELLRR